MNKGTLHEALYYEVKNNEVLCKLCPHHCILKENNIGICGVRQFKRDGNDNIKLYTLNYGKITSLAIDPIEKKPLYNFHPGTNILSIGSFGCNFKCSFCQNYSISQFKANYREVSAEDMADLALSLENTIGIAFTYNEPSIWYEYVLDVAKRIKEKNKKSKVVLITNGYINEEPLRKLLPYIDAINIDLKGNNEYYDKLCKGTLEPVLRTIQLANEMGCYIEVTTLLIGGENTSDDVIVMIGDFLSKVDKKIPLHISRYFPNYQMKNEPTPLSDIKKAYDYLKMKLDNVYLGNLSPLEKDYVMGNSK